MLSKQAVQLLKGLLVGGHQRNRIPSRTRILGFGLSIPLQTHSTQQLPKQQRGRHRECYRDSFSGWHVSCPREAQFKGSR
uniref:Uncharacterized protein n=1 Tax=uncultured marine group II/III euryarchaeote KM3_54_D07 TaxID=1456460 RepID=A0A075H6K6_9EURY|nr:hypothetical protein [uncultured marine group II/III euryarchaeote KM3_54_D07]